MAQKLLVNTTGFDIEGTITGRVGNTPGQTSDTVSFSLSPNLQQFVAFGDATNPQMDSMQLSTIDEKMPVSLVIDLSKDKASDNLFNTNDTLFISIENETFVVSVGNTWTVYR